MDKFVLGIFVDELLHQCDFALMSWEYLQTSLEKLKSREETDSLDVNIRIFCYIQSFLIAVANISKLLWNEKYRSRGEELRRELQVPMNSPLKDKHMRNVFEHYDENIRRWASSSRRKNISDMNISVNGFSAIPSLDPIDCMRNLDISRDGKNLTLTFHGEPYDLTIAGTAVRELKERARRLRPSLF